MQDLCRGRSCRPTLPVILAFFVGGTVAVFFVHLHSERYYLSTDLMSQGDSGASFPSNMDFIGMHPAPKTSGTTARPVSPQHSYRTTPALGSIAAQESRAAKHGMDVEAEQRRRKEQVDRACARLGKSRTLPAVSWAKTVHFLASDKFNFLFCFAPKVSCTTWKGVMSTLYKAFPRSPRLKKTPTSQSGRFLKMSDILDPKEVVKRWRTYNKVMFTREPLERVLSAYLDKFVYGKRKGFELNFGSIILKRYRNMTGKKVKYPLEDKITFEEFIRFITDNGPKSAMTQQTDHWLPVSRITSPCQFNYDFIGHYETLQYDAPYVIQHYNLSKHVSFPEVHSSRSHERLIKAYREIPTHLIYRLIDYYKDDYELFGYSSNRTLDIILKGSV